MSSKKISSLQEFCLNCIVCNFQRFYDAYKLADVNVSHNYFEFLQRSYSRKLLSALSKENSLKDNYMDFLINPYIKELCLHQQKIDVACVIKQLKEVGNTITVLDIGKIDIPESELKELVSLVPNVEILNLSHSICTDDVLLNIAKNCPLIKSLDLSFSLKVSDEGIKNLCQRNRNKIVDNTVLENLNICATNTTKAGIGFVLKHFPYIKIFQCHSLLCSVIYENHIQEFLNNSLDDVPKYRLTEISCMKNSDNDYALADVISICSILCPDVTILKVSDIEEDSEFKICAQFPSLKEVIFYCYSDNITFSGMESFLKMKGSDLIKFELQGGTICVKSVSEHCSKLQSLILKHINFFDLNAETIDFKFPNLTELNCEGVDFLNSSVVDSIKALISHSPKMQKLSLVYSSSFSDDIVDTLLKNNSLSTLLEINVSYTDISLSSVEKFLAAAPNLEKLYIECCVFLSASDYEYLLQLSYETSNGIEISWVEEESAYSESEDVFNMLEDYDYDFYDYDYDDHGFDCDYDEYDVYDDYSDDADYDDGL